MQFALISSVYTCGDTILLSADPLFRHTTSLA